MEKVRRLEKSTPAPVVMLLTNKSYVHGPTKRTLVVMRHLKEQSLTPASADIVNVDDGYG